MREMAQFLMLVLLISGCKMSHQNFSEVEGESSIPKKIITSPFYPDSDLTNDEIESIRLFLSAPGIKNVKEVKEKLSDGFRFIMDSYSVMMLRDANGVKLRTNTTCIEVCRLSKDKDLVLIYDNRDGYNIIKKWYVRDLPLDK